MQLTPELLALTKIKSGTINTVSKEPQEYNNLYKLFIYIIFNWRTQSKYSFDKETMSNSEMEKSNESSRSITNFRHSDPMESRCYVRMKLPGPINLVRLKALQAPHTPTVEISCSAYSQGDTSSDLHIFQTKKRLFISVFTF